MVGLWRGDLRFCGTQFPSVASEKLSALDVVRMLTRILKSANMRHTI